MAELLSIRSRADKDDIRSASNRHLATYRHLEQFLTAFTCEKDNEKDTCFTKSLPFCNSPLEINRVNKQLGKVEKTQTFPVWVLGDGFPPPHPPPSILIEKWFYNNWMRSKSLLWIIRPSRIMLSSCVI